MILRYSIYDTWLSISIKKLWSYIIAYMICGWDKSCKYRSTRYESMRGKQHTERQKIRRDKKLWATNKTLSSQCRHRSRSLAHPNGAFVPSASHRDDVCSASSIPHLILEWPRRCSRCAETNLVSPSIIENELINVPMHPSHVLSHPENPRLIQCSGHQRCRR